MGSRKHGRSGHATQSPRFRLSARLDAERMPERQRPKAKFLCFPARSRADPKVWRVAMPLGRAELGVPASLALAATYTREVGVGSTEFGKRAQLGAPAGTARDALRPRRVCRNRQLGLAGRAHESSGTANGYGAAGLPGERAVLRTRHCGQRCRSRNLDFAGGARTAADGSLVL